MRKVHADCEVTLMLPIRVKVSWLVRADEDANVGKAIQRLLKGHGDPRADLEDITVEELVSVGGINLDDESALAEAISEALAAGEGHDTEVSNIVVTDSR